MTDVLDTLKKLPPICAATLPSTSLPVLIRRGVMGYWAANPALDIDAFNARHDITPAQVEAMTAGSMFGWDCPAADPDTYQNA